MGVVSFCYILEGLADEDVLHLREVIQAKNLTAKMAVLGRKNNRSKVEINVLDEKVMELIAKIYSQRYGSTLEFAQYGAR